MNESMEHYNDKSKKKLLATLKVLNKFVFLKSSEKVYY